jgi:hypothetical protein
VAVAMSVTVPFTVPGMSAGGWLDVGLAGRTRRTAVRGRKARGAQANDCTHAKDRGPAVHIYLPGWTGGASFDGSPETATANAARLYLWLLFGRDATSFKPLAWEPTIRPATNGAPSIIRPPWGIRGLIVRARTCGYVPS